MFSWSEAVSGMGASGIGVVLVAKPRVYGAFPVGALGVGAR